MTLQAPFPWFGDKSRVAAEIWQRFGKVDNYVEPFFGSGAVLLARPTPRGVETINDADGNVANFWRATKHAPDEVAKWCDWPVNETDLAARHYWLVTEGRERLARVLTDPDGYDARVAGWWCWGICSWIGGGWCAGDGPWVTGDDGGWVKKVNAGQGITRGLPHLGNAGRGINRKLPHSVHDWFAMLSERLRHVRVAHGDWARVTGDSVTWGHGKTAVFLDPPYGAAADRTANVYAKDCLDVAAKARDWAIEAGKRTDMLICLAGYDTEHDMPADWSVFAWKAAGGFGSQSDGQGRKNSGRETLWFSPACRPPEQDRLL